MAKVLGYFVFQNIGDGCLISKYSNLGLQSPLSECTKRKKEDPELPEDPFCGTFSSTWIEDPNNSKLKNQIGQAELIVSKVKTKEGIYRLEWDKGAKFSGEGMIFDGLLVGAYWDQAVADVLK